MHIHSKKEYKIHIPAQKVYGSKKPLENPFALPFFDPLLGKNCTRKLYMKRNMFNGLSPANYADRRDALRLRARSFPHPSRYVGADSHIQAILGHPSGLLARSIGPSLGYSQPFSIIHASRCDAVSHWTMAQV